MNADDPRLTAYALGELSGKEAAQIAAAIERDPRLAAEVKAIQAMAGGLEEALGAEVLPETEPVKMAEHIEFPMDKRAPKRFPYFWVSGLAAAGFAVLVMVQSPESPLVGRESISVAMPRSTAAPQSGAPPVEMPALDKVSDQPERYADDLLLAEADYSEKDPFVIAVDPAPFPMPPASTEAMQSPMSMVASTLPQNNVERLEENKRSPGGSVDEEKLLTAAETVAVAKEEFEQTRSQVPTEYIEAHDVGYADATTLVGSGSLQVQGNITNENHQSLDSANSGSGGPNSWSGSVDVPNAFGGQSREATINGYIDFGDDVTRVIKTNGGSIDVNKRVQNYGGMVKTGDGTLVLSGGNSFTGRTRMAVRQIVTPETHSGEDYAVIDDQGWQRVMDHPLSTFAVDVDSASYANVRRFLQSGNLPPIDAVKVEELVNAFSYNYGGPAAGEDAPLLANLEVAAAPWAPEHRLVRIGLKAEEMPTAERGAANLVFLMDVSGSMNSPKKLPLVKEALRMLMGRLREDDRIAIVTYAGWSGLALPSTQVSNRQAIESVLRDLKPGGSTNGALGIHLAYEIAKANFVPGGVNRVILCTDGDFNVGTTGLGELGELITEKAKSDVFLTALGFGMGNYQDDTLEQLANKGNGHHGYIDSVREARRLLVEQVEGTLNTVARDVKIQVEFNPAQVAAYRLIGYDNRRLAPEEFNDDTIDAGEIGAGHTVTALYEVIPAGSSMAESLAGVDELRYQAPRDRAERADLDSNSSAELLTVKLRAQPPEGGASRKWEFHLEDSGSGFDHASPEFKFAAAVAGFGLVLRDHPSVAATSLAQIEGWARSGITDDPGGYRHEFLDLVNRANQLTDQ